MKRKQPYKSGFIIKGWNDQPQLCPKYKCKGLVFATNDIRYGECTSCHSKIPWKSFQKQFLKRGVKHQEFSKNP